ncbi:hypothetical protein, conserved [Eimeria acervulina]|uniref:Uncharacterized protein n=1 Tax=Eimeria acervulina TaxID=5801 RepID=U6GD64_EIMAC|nr:hypothetical protein, conserved [Eimeria acervulina]CDI77492.1 hypothetical protein, conserved [Eimeria acervulina]
MDPLTIVRWLGVCAEPPIEEAQPAWWVELQRSEAVQNKEKARNATQQAALPSAVSSNLASEGARRKVRFASEPTADPHGFYETDAEFVISPSHPDTQTSLTRDSEHSELASWDLSDLEDASAIRRMLIPTADTPRSSAGSFTATSVDLYHGSHPSSAEPVFHEFCGSSMNSASSDFTSSARQTGG